jgi:hypothetical protein
MQEADLGTNNSKMLCMPQAAMSAARPLEKPGLMGLAINLHATVPLRKKNYLPITFNAR